MAKWQRTFFMVSLLGSALLVWGCGNGNGAIRGPLVNSSKFAKKGNSKPKPKPQKTKPQPTPNSTDDI